MEDAMFNPFLLHGGAFLLFYLALALVVIWGLRLVYRAAEGESGSAAMSMTDPYLIACLRGGAKEALRVATVALLDRGLLTAAGTTLTSRNRHSVKMVNRPIEKAILARYISAGDADAVFWDPAARAACDAYKKALADNGLLADGSVYGRRLLPTLVALGVLIGVTIAKVGIAHAEGRHNVGFLATLTLVACIAILVLFGRSRTAHGDATMADLRQLFSRLKARAKGLAAGGKTNEAALLAAIFGISALSESSFPFLRELYPRKSPGDGGSSCGSSGSSCGSSCGGGCGGGGCGG
jgi:uncharacterized protein (TIGR04222 family)